MLLHFQKHHDIIWILKSNCVSLLPLSILLFLLKVDNLLPRRTMFTFLSLRQVSKFSVYFLQHQTLKPCRWLFIFSSRLHSVLNKVFLIVLTLSGSIFPWYQETKFLILVSADFLNIYSTLASAELLLSYSFYLSRNRSVLG